MTGSSRCCATRRWPSASMRWRTSAAWLRRAARPDRRRGADRPAAAARRPARPGGRRLRTAAWSTAGAERRRGVRRARHRQRASRSSVTRSSSSSSGSWRGAIRRATGNVLGEARDLPARRVRHADRRVHPQRRAAQPDAGEHLVRAARDRAAAGRPPGRRRPRRAPGGRGGRRARAARDGPRRRRRRSTSS